MMSERNVRRRISSTWDDEVQYVATRQTASGSGSGISIDSQHSSRSDDNVVRYLHTSFHNPRTGRFEPKGLEDLALSTILKTEEDGLFRAVREGHAFMSCSKVQYNTSILSGGDEEFATITRERSILCLGSYPYGQITSDLIKKGELIPMGVLHPGWFRQGCYAFFLEGILTYAYASLLGPNRRGLLLNQNISGGGSYSLTPVDPRTGRHPDKHWHGVAITFFPRKQTIETGLLRVGVRPAIMDPDATKRQHLAEMYRSQLQSRERRELLETMDREMVAATAERRAELLAALERMNNEGLAKHGRGRMVKLPEYSMSIQNFMNADAFRAYRCRVAEEDIERIFADVCREHGLRSVHEEDNDANSLDNAFVVGRGGSTNLTDRQQEKLDEVYKDLDKLFQEVREQFNL